MACMRYGIHSYSQKYRHKRDTNRTGRMPG